MPDTRKSNFPPGIRTIPAGAAGSGFGGGDGNNLLWQEFPFVGKILQALLGELAHARQQLVQLLIRLVRGWRARLRNRCASISKLSVAVLP